MLEWLKKIVAPPNASNPTVWDRPQQGLDTPTPKPDDLAQSQKSVRDSALHSDAPISGSAQEPDLLNREEFAKRIAEGLRTVPSANGFVLSLEGPWGFGKTSMLNLIEKNFQAWPADEQPVVCRFNPWMVGNAETLVQSFLVQLASAIGSKDTAATAQRAANELLGYSSVFTALKFVPGAEPWATMVQQAVKTVGGAVKDVANLKNLDLEKRKESVVRALKDFHRRIAVFIDDLDRLPPSEVFQMVRLAKSVGDFPGVIYVICFDSTYVASALREFQLENAEGYLDKVIQTRLGLPIISKDDLLAILNKEYDSLPKEATVVRFAKQAERVSEMYYFGLRSVLETPRDIKRLFNRLRFTEPGCRGDVNIADLMGLEAIAIKAPTVYEHIKRNPVAYTGRESGPILAIKKASETVKELEAERREALDKVHPALRGAVDALLEKLFPLLRSEHFTVGEAQALSQGLVSLPDRLSIALSAGLPSQEVSITAAVQFITSADQREDLSREIRKAGKLTRFVEHLQHAQRDNKVVDLTSFASVLGRALDSPEGVAAESKRADVFDPRPSRRIWWAIKAALDKLAPPERVPVLEGIARDASTQSLATEVVTFLQAQHGAFPDDRALPEDQRWVDGDTLTRMTNAWAEIAVNAIRDRTLYTKALAGPTLYRLRRFKPDLYAAALREAIPNDENLDQLIVAYGHKGTDSTGGDYASFRDEEFDLIGGVERMKERARQRLSDERVTGRLKHAYESIVTGKKIYLDSGAEGDH
jgi:hypothetical protein